MRIVFAGTPEAAVPSLRALAASEHEVALVITRPDAPLGRKRIMTPSPVAAAAAELGLPVLKAARLDAEATEAITAVAPELGVIVAYGGLVREPLLSAPDRGWINLHFSLLPRWRGAAPVQRSLIAGDRIGWAVFDLVPALDAGDVYVQEAVEPERSATAGVVLAQLADIGADRLAGIVTDIGNGLTPTPQVGEPTHAAKLTIADAALPLEASAETIFNHYRGVTPEPGARVLLASGALKIVELAETATSTPVPVGTIRAEEKRILLGTTTTPLEILRVQPAGKQAMSAADWWRGLRVQSLDLLESEASA